MQSTLKNVLGGYNYLEKVLRITQNPYYIEENVDMYNLSLNANH